MRVAVTLFGLLLACATENLAVGGTSSTTAGPECPEGVPTCRWGPAAACGDEVDPLCAQGVWECPANAVEASQCADDSGACLDPPPQCWIPDGICEDSELRDPVCREDRVWQCPPGTTETCGHGHSACDFDSDVTCVSLGREGCTDIIVEPDCSDERGWFCGRGAIDIQECGRGTGSSTEGSGSDTDTETGSSSSGAGSSDAG